MAENPSLIVQIPRGGAVDRQLSADPPPSLSGAAVVVERGPTDGEGVLEPPVAGQVVMSLPSPEALRREAGRMRDVIDEAGTSTEPIVVVIEAADELREEELTAVLTAAGRARRPVILRVIRDG